MSNLIARGHRVLLKIPKLQQKTSGGIILTESTLSANRVGTEVGIFINKGELADLDYKEAGVDFPFKEGDYVYFEKHTGTYTKDRDENEFRFVWASDLVGTADPEYIEKYYDVGSK